MKHLGLVIGLVAGTLAGHAAAAEAAAEAEASGATLSKIESRTLPAAEVKRLVLRQLRDILIEVPVPADAAPATAPLIQRAYWTKARATPTLGICEADFLIVTLSPKGVESVAAVTRYASLVDRPDVDGELTKAAHLAASAACAKVNPADGGFFDADSAEDAGRAVANRKEPMLQTPSRHSSAARTMDTRTLDALGDSLIPPQRGTSLAGHRRPRLPLSEIWYQGRVHSTSVRNLCAVDTVVVGFQPVDVPLYGADTQTQANGLTTHTAYRFIGPPPTPGAPHLTGPERLKANSACAWLNPESAGFFSADTETLAARGGWLLNLVAVSVPASESCLMEPGFCTPQTPTYGLEALSQVYACNDPPERTTCTEIDVDAGNWAEKGVRVVEDRDDPSRVRSVEVRDLLILADERAD